MLPRADATLFGCLPKAEAGHNVVRGLVRMVVLGTRAEINAGEGDEGIVMCAVGVCQVVRVAHLGTLMKMCGD